MMGVMIDHPLIQESFEKMPFSLTATQITLTSILSQDGRGGKRGGRHPN